MSKPQGAFARTIATIRAGVAPSNVERPRRAVARLGCEPAVTNNRARLKSGVAREAFKLRAEIVERCFAHNLDRGGMRRTWLRGRENVHKRYLLHVAGHNLSLLMRQLIGAGTPRVASGYGGIFVLLTPTGAMLVARGVSQSGQTAFAAAFLIWE